MQLINNPNYSYWELKQYFEKFDLIVIGSGIVGLSTALSFKQKNKKAKVLILERGIIPSGASSKNAGFACFGSAGELLDDLQNMPENVVWETVRMRWEGLKMLRKRLGDEAMAFKQSGGYELFTKQDDYYETSQRLSGLNAQMHEILGLKKCYETSKKPKNFKNITGTILNRYEGEINTGYMMDELIKMAQKKEIKILNSVTVSRINDLGSQVELTSDAGVFKAAKVIVATNGFASQLLNLKDIKPARAQVLITDVIPALNLKGTYHYEQGYYYFRNIDNRILLGGGRNLAFKTETTTETAQNKMIQDRLERLLRETIVPGISVKIAHRWTGIMGAGKEKKPIIKFVSQNVLAAVRMGGMGIAIGTWVGEKAATEVE